MPLDYLHTRHEPGDADVVGHGLGHEVLSWYVHVGRGQGEITEEPAAVLQEKWPAAQREMHTESKYYLYIVIEYAAVVHFMQNVNKNI